MSNHMTPEEIKFSLIIKNMEIPFKINEKEDRIILQKIGYFCNVLGLKLNEDINYSWYKNGPYSPDLTKIYYSIDSKLSVDIFDFLNHNLENDEIQKIKIVKKLYSSKPEAISEEDWMELTASIKFLYDADFKTKELLKYALKNLDNKKHLNIEEFFDEAFNKLKELNFIPN